MSTAPDVNAVARLIAHHLLSDVGDGRTYMIIDAARDPSIYPALVAHQDDLEMMSLYQGETADNLADVAPYLIRLEAGAPFVRWLTVENWGKSWGIFLRASVDFQAVRRRMRRFTVAATESGQTIMFRFYDPRVLRLFLPIGEPDQLTAMFTDIDAFLMEDEDAQGLISFQLIDGALRPVRYAPPS